LIRIFGQMAILLPCALLSSCALCLFVGVEELLASLVAACFCGSLFLVFPFVLLFPLVACGWLLWLVVIPHVCIIVYQKKLSFLVLSLEVIVTKKTHTGS